MSIVLVVIGLIVGGILTGRSLIEQAQLRGTVTAMDHYKQAYNAFVLKYNCVPGDCANAISFGLASWTCVTLQNGDGDGYIYAFSDGTTLPGGAPAKCEAWYAFINLFNAGLIQDNFYSMGSGSSPSRSNLPIANNAFMLFTSLRPKSPPAGYTLPDKDTNYLYVGTYPGNGIDLGTIAPVLTPAQAKVIDQKIDDGMPMSGSVRASFSFVGITTGPPFNAPSLQSGNGAVSCVDDRVTPPVYMSNGWSSSFITAYCNIHVPVN